MATTKKKQSPSMSAEAQEKKLVNAAYRLAEERILDGTASSQIISHFLAMGSPKHAEEVGLLRARRSHIEAQTKAIASGERDAEMFEDAINAMRRYQGGQDFEEDDIDGF